MTELNILMIAVRERLMAKLARFKILCWLGIHRWTIVIEIKKIPDTTKVSKIYLFVPNGFVENNIKVGEYRSKCRRCGKSIPEEHKGVKRYD